MSDTEEWKYLSPGGRAQLYEQYRKEVLVKQSTNADNYDKSLLTLSSGGLGISLAVLKDVAPAGAVANWWLLMSSWVLFSVTIVATLASFQVSQAGLSRALKNAENFLLKRQEKAFEAPNVWSILNTVLAIVSGVCFGLAVVASAWFVSSNLMNRNIPEVHPPPASSAPAEPPQPPEFKAVPSMPTKPVQTTTNTAVASETRGQPVHKPSPIIVTPPPVIPGKK